MTGIVTRLGKGSALTFAELDGNIEELDRRTQSGWNDIIRDVLIRPGTGNDPALTNYREGLYFYDFSHTAVNECFATFHMPHDYKPGTMVYPHVHWTINTINSGVVRWGVEYTLARRNDTGAGGLNTGQCSFPATQFIYMDHPVFESDEYTHHVNEPGDNYGIDGTELEPDAAILCRFFRDATSEFDTYPASIFLIYIGLHYETDTIGTPNRRVPFI